MKLLLRLLVNAAALWAAVQLVPGIRYDGEAVGLLAVALVFGVLNAVVRPILVWLTCPLVLLTLGLFLLVLNGVLLWLTGAFAGALGIAFQVAGFGAAFVGALVVSIVSTVLTIFVGEKPKKKR